MTKEEFFIITFLHWLDDYESEYTPGIVNSFTLNDIVDVAEKCNIDGRVTDAIKRYNNLLVKIDEMPLDENCVKLCKKRDKLYEFLKRMGKKFYRKHENFIEYPFKSID